MAKAILINPGFDRAKKLAADGTAQGLFEGAEHVLQVSKTRVPHEEGTLERSGASSVDRASLRSAVVYDTPYAVAQHENLEYNHKGKGQAKYLESAGNSERARIKAIVAANIRRKLGT